MNKIDYLIHAKWIITCAEKNQILTNHVLAISNSKIADILPYDAAIAQYPQASIQSFPTHAILPGFINAHTHVAMNLFRGLADDLALMTWLTEHIWPAESKWLSESFVYDGSLLAIAEMIRSGTTCFNDMFFFPEQTARAAKEAKMRAYIGMTIMDLPTAWASNTEAYFAKSLAFYEQYKNEELITATFAPQSTYTVDQKNLLRIKELANQLNLKINIHLQEAPSEMETVYQKYKKRPLGILNELGMIDENLLAIHMTQLNEADLQLLAEKKLNIVHCPESNMKLASGDCPVARLTELGINVALGTDGAASNNDLDMIGEMKSAAFLGKLAANDSTALPAEQVLKMATINGAKALGIDHLTGSLAKDKYADFIAIDLSHIETQPIYHPLSQIVYASGRNQVTDVWVAGKQILKNRELTFIDEKEILKKAEAWREKISI